MKRRLLIIVLFLLLGAVVNVAVVQACALWVNPVTGNRDRIRFVLEGLDWQRKDGGPGGLSLGDRHEIQPISIPGSSTLWWVDCYWKPGAHRLVRLSFSAEPTRRRSTGSYGVLPKWASFDTWAGDLGPNRGYEVIDARGWPLVCMRLRFKVGHGTFYQWQYINEGSLRDQGYTLKPATVPTGFVGATLPVTRRALPLDPIWNHFVVNTVFYAGLIGGPFAARHLLRRMRGLCLICGYNLRGDLSQGCPKCGWGRKSEGADMA